MIIQVKGDVIKLRGSLVENQWPAIKSAVSLLLEEHPGGAVIDSSNLTEVTEAGARTFIDASNFIQAHSARVIIAGIPDQILEQVRQIPGVRSQLVLASSVDEARASLSAGGAGAAVEVRTKPAVLVPLVGAWQRALHFASAEALARKAELHVLHVLQVPRNLPIGAPMPEKEEEAQQNLLQAEGLLKRRGVVVRRRTTRARDVVEGTAKFAAATKPELLVVAYYKDDFEMESLRHSVVTTLCHEAPCDVAVYCVNR